MQAKRAWRSYGIAQLDSLAPQEYTRSVSTVDNLPEDERLDLLQGTLEVLILRSLKLQPNHAYGISQFLQQQSDSEFLVDNGSLYPALQRLLQREWISAQWKTSPNGRRARYYSLTAAGRKQLVKATTKWQRFALAMARVLTLEGLTTCADGGRRQSARWQAGAILPRNCSRRRDVDQLRAVAQREPLV
ncbi:MAG TPA: PadR family transcriptional regulator [Acidobacteriaceae bacterium]